MPGRGWTQMLVAAAALAVGPACGDSRANAPNLVMVVLDTTRADHLGLYGYDKPTSPFLDRLGDGAVVFRNAYSSSASTAPASASLFTSQSVRNHGVTTGFFAHQRQVEELRQRGETVIPLNRIPRAAPTLPETLKRAGYRTFGLASNINIGEEIGFTRGFDRFERHPEADADELFRHLLEWEAELRDGESPFFLYLHLNDAHRPYRARKPWIRDMWRSDEERRGSSAVYDSEIRFMDEVLARIFERLGLPGDAIVIVTSDHGEEFFDHGSWEHGPTLYRELNRIVLLIRPVGGVAGPQWVDAPVSIIDVLPTVIDLIGESAEASWAGTSLRPLFPDSADPGRAALEFDRRPIFAQKGRPGGKEVYAIVQSGWKHIWRPGHYRVLYEVARDPFEDTSLFGARPELADRLHRALVEYRNGASSLRHEVVAVPLDAEKFEHLRELGYVESAPDPSAER